jgi:hypothetical protein
VIADLKADVAATAASASTAAACCWPVGNGIGTPAARACMRACSATPSPTIPSWCRWTINGDFRIDDSLSPRRQRRLQRPVLLIINGAGLVRGRHPEALRARRAAA